MPSSACMSFAVMAGIVLGVAGCDKPPSPASLAETILPPGAPALDLAAKPALLFQVFGDREELRVVPVAAVLNGVLTPIGLTLRGWHLLDSMYFAPGTRYPVYHDAIEIGNVVISRGMWNGGEAPLSPMAGCSALKPLAAARITFRQARADPYVELVASTAPLITHAPFKGTLLTEAEVAKVGREFGHAVGQAAGLQNAELDSLDFHARLLLTGANREPTLLVSFIDPNAGDIKPGAGHTTHLFALGEKTGAAYEPAYRHPVSGDAKGVEFQRIVDHLDVNGDGVDEILVDAWRYGADNELAALSFRNGQWSEMMRVKQSWCLDPPKPGKK